MNTEKPANDYEAIIAVLEAKKSALEAAIANLRFVASGGAGIPPGIARGDLGLAASLASSSTGGTISSIDDIPNGAFHGKSITEATKLYLEMIKKKQTSKEISEALLRGGIETTSSTFQANVNTILKRATEAAGTFVRIGDAWGLPDWYHPGLRGSQAKPTNNKPRKKKRAAAKRQPVTVKRSKPNGQAMSEEPPAVEMETEGLQVRIMSLLTREYSKQFSLKEIADKVNGAQRGVSLNLGQLRKSGKIESIDGKFRIKIPSQSRI